MSKKIKDTVHVHVEYFTGQEEENDVGHPYYVAHSDELMFTTDGDTFEDLLKNVRECLLLCLQDTDSITEYGVLPDASIKLIMDLTWNYAETA
jgi:predicted RNase H-like HicB family nuclease